MDLKQFEIQFLHDFGSSLIGFGKYADKSYSEVAETDYQYLEWLSNKDEKIYHISLRFYLALWSA